MKTTLEINLPNPSNTVYDKYVKLSWVFLSTNSMYNKNVKSEQFRALEVALQRKLLQMKFLTEAANFTRNTNV